MNNGLGRMFWGIVFITFHIYLGSIPILPSFVGWIIIIQGLNNLETFLDKKSKLMNIFGVLLIFLGLVNDFVMAFQINLYFFESMIIILSCIFEFVFFYYLFEFIYLGNKRYIIYQRIYIVLMTIYILFNLIIQIIPIHQSITVLVWIGGFAIRIILMSLISGKRKELINIRG